ncbi:unnamed protein product [Spirodela intermedia]|uniref:Uncharacterized protein n=1 Tax=Spirodela intermedia TaxID=51605 RepID=A0A7I8K1V8_SPIIN|nr:unnamed protein product [Spirodela intermedia]
MDVHISEEYVACRRKERMQLRLGAACSPEKMAEDRRFPASPPAFWLLAKEQAGAFLAGAARIGGEEMVFSCSSP